MKKKCRWLAFLLAIVITMSQVIPNMPMTTVSAFERVGNKDVETEDVEIADDETEDVEEETPLPDEEEQPEITTPGWYQIGDDWYYNDSNGEKVFGWKQIGNVWYYLDENNTEKPGVMLSDCKRVIYGKTYFFEKSGAMLTGWVKRNEGWYYTDGGGAMQTGWNYIISHWYYLDGNNKINPGLMVKNCKKNIGNKIYFFNDSGQMLTGWVERNEGWYYTEASGAMLTDWQKVGGYWYYLDRNNAAYPGLMVKNCKKNIYGNTYRFGAGGEMRTGWYRENGSWYYLEDSGLPASGWRWVNGSYYYLNPANGNKMEAGGWEKIDGEKYYFYNDGVMATGWIKLGENWYYTGNDGVMRHGWQQFGYAWYYFYWAYDSNGGPEGAMAKDTTINGYEVLPNGIMKESYIDVNLTTQYMRYIKDGSVLLECDVVTGLPRNGRATPPGEFKILEKKRNKILTGNIDPATGKPEYRTPVDYWMRITWSGIGFHDATWQPRFGGDWYKTHGSHGCINMPYWAAKQLYSLVSVGTRTVVHY